MSDWDIPDEICDAATRAAHDHTYYYSAFSLTDRDLGIMRSSTRTALRAALDAGLADLIRRPRVITAVGQLEALPSDVILRDRDGRAIVKAGRDVTTYWSVAGSDAVVGSKSLLRHAPLTVLWPTLWMEPESQPIDQSFTEAQIHEAYRRHARPDDWGVPALYEDTLISALEGKYDDVRGVDHDR